MWPFEAKGNAEPEKPEYMKKRESLHGPAVIPETEDSFQKVLPLYSNRMIARMTAFT